jgi:NADH dehydrogenase/NADH:ubiquinone oxidoreductase subunit G
MTVTTIVDDQPLEVKAGLSLLQACLDNDIFIPNLCHWPGASEPQASCRLCFVEVAGMAQPVTACTVQVEDQMVVQTDTPAVRRLQKTGLRLLLSVHQVDCKNCPANKKCVLQDLAKFLKVGLKPKSLEHHLKTPEIDKTHPQLDYYPNRCVLCGRCLQACREANGRARLAFAKRGFETVISLYGHLESDAAACDACDVCAAACPVAALLPKSGA